MSLFKDNMMRKLSKSVLAKSPYQKQLWHASEIDANPSVEIKNEVEEDK